MAEVSHQKTVSPSKNLQPVDEMQLTKNDPLSNTQAKAQVEKQNLNSEPQKDITQLIDSFIKRIEDICEDFGQQKQIEKYFQKAGTTIEGISNSLRELKNVGFSFKGKITQKGKNSILLKIAFEFFEKYLSEKKYKQLSNFQKAIYILDFESKANSIIDLLDGSMILPFDITNSDKQKYAQVWKHIQNVPCGNTVQLKAGLLQIAKVLGMTTYAVMNEQSKTGAFSKAIAFGLSYPSSLFWGQDSQLAVIKYQRNPTVEMATKIWQIPQNGVVRQLSKIGFKSISVNIKIYIPLNSQTLPKDITKFDPNAIQVRVLSNQSINFNQKSFFDKIAICSARQQEPQQIDTIIIHAHGGGFLALSSRSSQNYTRRWARKLKVPVFSIDYRKPPKHPFPTAPEDCFTAYKFIVEHIHKYFRIRPRNIILAGDSAGGNLACALTGLIMKNKLPLPKALLLAYPSLDLRRIFTSSKVHSFTDPLLGPQMLLLCLKQYLNNNQQYQKNPIASPILLTQQYINGTKDDKRFPINWPRTIIMVGNKDPLYDDSLRLMERMVSSNVECECHVYEELSHGFLSLDFIIEECNKTIKDSIKFLQKLVK